MDSYNTFTCPVIEVEGELCLEFSDELMEALDLSVGDVLQWSPTLNKSWLLTKKEKDDE